jgi:hypothetical protein
MRAPSSIAFLLLALGAAACPEIPGVTDTESGGSADAGATGRPGASDDPSGPGYGDPSSNPGGAGAAGGGVPGAGGGQPGGAPNPGAGGAGTDQPLPPWAAGGSGGANPGAGGGAGSGTGQPGGPGGAGGNGTGQPGDPFGPGNAGGAGAGSGSGTGGSGGVGSTGGAEANVPERARLAQWSGRWDGTITYYTTVFLPPTNPEDQPTAIMKEGHLPMVMRVDSMDYDVSSGASSLIGRAAAGDCLISADLAGRIFFGDALSPVASPVLSLQAAGTNAAGQFLAFRANGQRNADDSINGILNFQGVDPLGEPCSLKNLKFTLTRTFVTTLGH